jgi:hypothetical protein
MVVVLPAPLTPTIRITCGRPAAGWRTGDSLGEDRRELLAQGLHQDLGVGELVTLTRALRSSMIRLVASTPTSAVSSRVSSSSSRS